jgi:hypothetical protein
MSSITTRSVSAADNRTERLHKPLIVKYNAHLTFTVQEKVIYHCITGLPTGL